MKVKNKESAITLIALVVTIVILLILAAVSIGMLAGENGIIKQAQDSKEKTDIADEKERVELAAVAAAGKDGWGEITEENLAEELTKNIGTRDEDYTLSKEGESFLVTYTDSNRSYIVDANGNIIEVVKRDGLKVGDYVDYVPDENTDGYSADRLIEAITGDTRNTSTITQDQQYAKDGAGMTWQILRIYKDGSIDLIGSPTNQIIYFNGANGYNNGVTVMNDICETLYSRGTIKARSVNYEDLEYWLTDAGKAIRNGYSIYPEGPTYGQTKTYTSSYYRYYPNLYAKEIGAGIDTETVNTTGLGISDKGTTNEEGYTQANTSLTVTQTYWQGEMNSTNFGEGYRALQTTKTYWIASRSAACDSPGVDFGIQSVSDSNIIGVLMFNSRIITGGGNYCIRPIVSLSSSVRIESCVGENRKDNMHKIIQY